MPVAFDKNVNLPTPMPRKMLIYKDRKNANRQQAIIGEFVQSNRSKGGYSYTLARFDNDYKYFQNDIEDYISLGWAGCRMLKVGPMQ